MIGLLLLYFIGNSFYKLADEFSKNKWAFAILGVVTYYAGGFLFGIGIAIVYGLLNEGNMEDVPSYVWDLLAVPIGLGCCYALHKFLKWQWTKKNPATAEQILDADLMN